jgi:tetratricopeptide (TPR) repeat protein
MRMRRAIVRGAILGGTAWAVAAAVRRSAGLGSPWTAPDDRDVPRSLNNLAVRRLRRGLDDSAEPLLDTARDVLDRADPPRPAALLTVRANQAALRTLRAARERAADRDDAARRLLVEAVELVDGGLPETARATARALANLARLEQTSGDAAAAARLFERALAVREEAVCTSAEEAAENLMGLADLHEALGQPGAADACLDRAALILRETSSRAGRVRLGACLGRRASLAHTGGRLVEAGSLYRHALHVKIATLGPRHPSVARTLEDHAALLRDLDRPAQAAVLEARARPIRARSARRDPLRRVEPLDTFLIPLAAQSGISV